MTVYGSGCHSQHIILFVILLGFAKSEDFFCFNLYSTLYDIILKEADF